MKGASWGDACCGRGPQSTMVDMPQTSRWSLLLVRDFRLLFLARLCTSIALQAQLVIVGWEVYQLRPDPLLLGFLGLTEAVPAIGCAFVAGYMVDSFRPATVFRSSVAVLFANTLLLFLYVLPQLPMSVDQRIGLLFCTFFVSGASRVFTSASIFSLVPNVVAREQLPSAAAWNGSAYQFASIIGPAVGGLLYGFAGAGIAFAAPAVIQAAGWVAAESLSRSTKQLQTHTHREPFLQSVAAGLKFTVNNRVLFSTMTLDMFSVLFGGAVAVLPIYADQVLHVGSTGLGALRAAPAIGSAIVSLYLALRPMNVISGQALLTVVAGFGVSTILFSVSTNFILSFVFLGLSGAFDGVSMVIRSTILQLLTPDKMRGRVSSVNSLFLTSSNEIGAFESGVAARFMGLVPSVLFGGVMTLVVVAATAWFYPELRRTRISAAVPPEEAAT